MPVRQQDKGIINILALLGIALITLALPLTAHLVKQRQEKRTIAADCYTAGSRRCSGNSVQECQKDPGAQPYESGTWVTIERCNTGDGEICSNSQCVLPMPTNTPMPATPPATCSDACIPQDVCSQSAGSDLGQRNCSFGNVCCRLPKPEPTPTNFAPTPSYPACSSSNFCL